MTDTINDMENIMRKGKHIPKKQAGGYLEGPSHEEGGILASTNGEMVELEGGDVHRDGSRSKYEHDGYGNMVEIITYKDIDNDRDTKEQ